MLFALADLLSGSGREAEAEELLSTVARSNWDSEVVRKLFRFYADKHRAADAARLLIEASAARPGDTGELAETERNALKAYLDEKGFKTAIIDDNLVIAGKLTWTEVFEPIESFYAGKAEVYPF